MKDMINKYLDCGTSYIIYQKISWTSRRIWKIWRKRANTSRTRARSLSAKAAALVKIYSREADATMPIGADAVFQGNQGADSRTAIYCGPSYSATTHNLSQQLSVALCRYNAKLTLNGLAQSTTVPSWISHPSVRVYAPKFEHFTLPPPSFVYYNIKKLWLRQKKTRNFLKYIVTGASLAMPTITMTLGWEWPKGGRRKNIYNRLYIQLPENKQCLR